MATYGIDSLKGFLYQLKVFTYSVIVNIREHTVVFEGRDDIECVKDEDKLFSHSIQSYNQINLIQVKNGELDDSVIMKVVLNWLDQDNIQNPKYTLIHSQNYSFLSKKEMSEKIVKTLVSKNNSSRKLRSDSLLRKIYDKYLINNVFDEDKFKSDLDPILDSLIDNHQLITNNEIEKKDYEYYIDNFCSDVTCNIAKEKRLAILLSMLNQRVWDFVERGESCKIEFKDFLSLHNSAARQVNDNEYQPNFEIFRKKSLTEETIKNIFDFNKREVSQLYGIGLLKNDILDYLRYELFYRDIREVYFERKRDDIEYIETEAYDIFRDHEKLESDNRYKLFYEVVDIKLNHKDIILDRFSSKGCYIHLSSDEAPKDKQISWSKSDE
ncbi:MAG: hypothetical protein K2J89_01820 [Clostridia bacterium]|nr:hypothetical protein [Clostridia bacterium]